MTSPDRVVAVVGSANLDVVVTVDRFPAPGETVLGGDVVETAGGKGLNQALAVARTASAAMVACTGPDDAGHLLVTTLESAGVDVRHVRRAESPTGRAFIQVTGSGENSIVVAAGANRELAVDQVVRALEELTPVVVLAQLEVPLESVQAAARWAADTSARFVLNPSPVRDLPSALIAVCDPLVVNVTEAAQLTGAAGGAPVDDLAAALAGQARSVVVTDGAHGAYVASGGTVRHIPGRPAEVVDTTGAGDEFTGRLVASLAHGESLDRAAEAANLAAANLVARPRATRGGQW